MTDAFELALIVEALVVAASGGVIAYTAATNGDVVLYPYALVLAGCGLVVGGTAVMLAVGSSAEHDVFVLAAAVPFCLAGWRIATDAVATADHGHCVSPPDVAADGFGGERE